MSRDTDVPRDVFMPVIGRVHRTPSIVQRPHPIVRVIYFFVACVLVTVTVAGGYAYRWSRAPVAMPHGIAEVEIRSGSSVRAAARQLKERGVAINENAFVLLTRLQRPHAVLKAGIYEIRAEESPLDILDKLIRGEGLLAEIRFVEGWTFQQYRKVLDEHPDVRKDADRLADEELLKKIGAPERHPEGLFFPDTYRFSKGTTDTALLRRAYKIMQSHLQAAWAERGQTSPLTSAYDALVLASIIEKETGRGEERGMVSAVFTNRLRIGMRLQADPTVIYGVGAKFDGNLRRRDLQRDTPYNTYTRTGLPPTPIAMPSLASIRAAVQPAQSDVLYFVAQRDGSSKFSKTLDEHNQAVARFLRQGG